MDAELILIKDALNIFVFQGYYGIWFVPFALLPEFSTLGFKDFSRDFEFFVFEDVYLCTVITDPSSARKRTLCRIGSYSVLSFFFAAM